MFDLFSLVLGKNNVSAEDVKEALDRSADITLIDVRTRDEHRSGHIRGSMHITLQNLEENLHKIPDKTKKIYLYCQSGSRSSQAVLFLKHAGYSNVYTMTGGINAWRSKGYPLIK